MLRGLFDRFEEIDTPLTREFERFVHGAARRCVSTRASRPGTQRMGRSATISFAVDHGAILCRRAERGKAAGMRIGLISDLAIGMDRVGSARLGAPVRPLLGLSIGRRPTPSIRMVGIGG